MPAVQGQYGGQLGSAVTSNGGAALASGLGSAVSGMLTGGMSTALQAAAGALSDSGTTTQTAATGQATQSTGSKVFNLAPAQTAMRNNDFWANVVGQNSGGSWVLVAALALVGLVFVLLLRRK